MTMKGKLWSLAKWNVMKARLGYTGEEMKAFRGNPGNEDILSKAPVLMKKKIVLEVVESHGCNSRHKVGDKLYFDGAGNILSKHNPEKVCAYAMNAAVPLIYAAVELFYAGVDPNGMRFNRAACIDVGLKCGGWGRIVVEVSFRDR